MESAALSEDKHSSEIGALVIRIFASFVIGVVGGAVIIPGVHKLLYGQTDPLQYNWPICLHASTLISSLVIAFVFRGATAAAVGVFAGLVGFMLVSGLSEYPASSAIGLLIHGFVPAACGSAIALVVLNIRPNFSRTLGATNSVNPGDEPAGS